MIIYFRVFAAANIDSVNSNIISSGLRHSDCFFKAVIIAYAILTADIFSIFISFDSGNSIFKSIDININAFVRIIFIKSPSFDL